MSRQRKGKLLLVHRRQNQQRIRFCANDVALTTAVVLLDLQTDDEHGECERDGDQRHAEAHSKSAQSTSDIYMNFEGEIVLLLILRISGTSRIEEELQSRAGADEWRRSWRHVRARGVRV